MLRSEKATTQYTHRMGYIQRLCGVPPVEYIISKPTIFGSLGPRMTRRGSAGTLRLHRRTAVSEKKKEKKEKSFAASKSPALKCLVDPLGRLAQRLWTFITGVLIRGEPWRRTVLMLVLSGNKKEAVSYLHTS